MFYSESLPACVLISDGTEGTEGICSIAFSTNVFAEPTFGSTGSIGRFSSSECNSEGQLLPCTEELSSSFILRENGKVILLLEGKDIQDPIRIHIHYIKNQKINSSFFADYLD